MTKNRQGNISNLISYYSAYPVHLIIADGSNSPVSSKRLGEERFNSAANESFTWSYLKGPRPDDYLGRLSEALSLADSIYVALAPDDEVLIWSGILHAVSMLDLNSNLSSAGGSSVICKRFGRRMAYMDYLNYGFAPDDEFHAQGWQKLEICGETASDRIQEVVEKSMWHRFYIYRVFSKQALEQAVALWKATNLDLESGLGELIISLGTHLKGKSIFLDYPFWIRTLRSEGGGGANFGNYADQDLQVLAEKTVQAVSGLVSSENKRGVSEPELLGLLRHHYGPDSQIKQAVTEYVALKRKRKFRRATQIILSIVFPTLALNLLNARNGTRYAFENTLNPTFGFCPPPNTEEDISEVRRAAKAIKLLI